MSFYLIDLTDITAILYLSTIILNTELSHKTVCLFYNLFPSIIDVMVETIINYW